MKRDSYLVGRAFKSFLFASVMTVAASQMGAFIDGLMVTWFISDTAMSAINIAMPVIQLYFSLCLLLGVGGTILAGKAIGSHNRGFASHIFSLSASSAVIAGLVLGALGLVFFNPILNLLCPDPSIIGFAGEYMVITIPSAAVYMLMVVLQLFVALDGEPKRVTVAVSTCIAVNLVLDYIFIAGFGWEMTGAASATVISYLPAIAILLGHFRKKGTLRYRWPADFSELPAIMRNGTPSGFTALLMSVQIFVCNIVAIHYLGTVGVIVFAVCMYLLRLSMIILTGTIDSFQPVAAILAGSDDNRGVAMVLGKAYSFLGISLVVYAGIMILFPQWIGSLFSISGAEAEAVVRTAIPAFAFNIILQCAVGLLIPVYQVYGNTRPAMVVSIGQPLLPMLFFWIMAAAGLNAWWGFAIGQAALLVILLPAVMSRRGNRMPFFLIPGQSADKVYDTSVTPSIQDAGMQLVEADTWLREAGVDESLRFRIGVSCEEILKNIVDHAPRIDRKARSVDLRISLQPDGVTAVIHDAGRPFNPVEEDPKTGLGLMIAKKSCDTMKYEYMFNQNILTMTWDTGHAPDITKSQTPH